MEKKEKQIISLKQIILIVGIFLLGISIAFTTLISPAIQKMLYNNFNVRAVKGDMIVHFIDVGQGDCVAIQMPNSQIVVIDSGTSNSKNIVIDYIRHDVLKSNNNQVIDYLFLTHSDADHSGGVEAIFKEFEVKNFFRPNIASKTENSNNFLTYSTAETYDSAINTAKLEKGLNIKIITDGMSFNIGQVSIDIFGPLKKYSSTNMISPIIKISYRDKVMLFTGDVQDEAEYDLVNKYGENLDCDLLKVAHHGANDATGDNFVKSTTPRFAVISVGENSYGHPSFETLSNLESLGAEILRTDLEGNIRFVVNNQCLQRLNNKIIVSNCYIEWYDIACFGIVVLSIGLFQTFLPQIKKFLYRKKKIVSSSEDDK